MIEMGNNVDILLQQCFVVLTVCDNPTILLVSAETKWATMQLYFSKN